MECLAVAGAVVGGCTLATMISACYLRKPAPKVTEEQITAIGHKFVELPDGRKLEYSINGNPNGVPVYFQHGYISSAFVNPTWDNLAKECGVKIIAATMPGFGLSDSYPLGVERSLLDWPADVLAVLKEERIAKVHIFGISAGSVHAAALARGLPREMVGNVCFVSPTCPDDVPGATEQMSIATLMLRRLMGKPYVGDLIAFLIARLMNPRDFFRALPDCNAALERFEREMPEVGEGILATVEKGLQFTYRGITDNSCTIEKPPPFELAELGKLISTGSAMAITTSEDDCTNPPVMQRWLQGQIPGSKLMKFASGWGHFHSFEPANFRRILNFLITAIDPEDHVNRTLLEARHPEAKAVQHVTQNEHGEMQPLLKV